jgi:hypothetical protein
MSSSSFGLDLGDRYNRFVSACGSARAVGSEGRGLERGRSALSGAAAIDFFANSNSYRNVWLGRLGGAIASAQNPSDRPFSFNLRVHSLGKQSHL